MSIPSLDVNQVHGPSLKSGVNEGSREDQAHVRQVVKKTVADGW